MLVILDAFFRITLRQLGPEDLPDSAFLLVVSAMLYVALQGVMVLPVYGPSPLLFQVLAADFLLLYLFVVALLAFVGKRNRQRQTLTALFGTGALLALFAVPFNIWWDMTADDGAVAVLPVLAIFGIVIWSLVVIAHVLSRALSSPFAVGVMISLGYFMLNFLLLTQVRGPEL